MQIMQIIKVMWAIVIVGIGNIDPAKHTTEQVMKALMVVFESLLEDEENQILGFHYILDESGITGSHIMKLWNPTDMLKIWGTTEKGMPMRHKRMDFVQLPSLLGHVFTFAKGLMSKKLQSRIVLYKNAQALTKAIETKLLPKEYGGEVPMSEMIRKNQVILHLYLIWIAGYFI